MSKIKVSILCPSDGRARVHESLESTIRNHAQKLLEALTDTGEVEAEVAPEIITGEKIAKEMGVWANTRNADAILFSMPIFAFPNLTAIAARIIQQPVAVIAPCIPELPALGGMQAAVNMIRQNGGQCEKFYGSYDNEHIDALMNFLRACKAKTRLMGQVYGLIGGRSIGMGSGVAPSDRWMQQFGIDVEHIDQLELVRRTDLVPQSDTLYAVEWLEKHLRNVEYDGGKLTRENLMRQAAFYIATRSIVQERGLDFIGIKCHYELSEYDVTQCLSAMLLGENEDWNGPKTPVPCACEADSDAALTMQVLGLITGLPVLFLDFRYMSRDGLLSLCNCGAMTCWYSRGGTLLENLSQVKAVPVIPKYGGGGAHFSYMAKPSKMTFARFTHTPDTYKITVFKGETVNMPEEKMNETAPQWPHAFVRPSPDFDELLARYDSNHVHAVQGDCVEALRSFCILTGVEFDFVE